MMVNASLLQNEQKSTIKKNHKIGQYDFHVFWASQYERKGRLNNLPIQSSFCVEILENIGTIFCKSSFFKTANVFAVTLACPLADVPFCIFNGCVKELSISRILHLPLEPVASVWQYYMKQLSEWTRLGTARLRTLNNRSRSDMQPKY